MELDRVTRDARHRSLSTYKRDFEEPLLEVTGAFYDCEAYRVLGDFAFIEFVDYVSVANSDCMYHVTKLWAKVPASASSLFGSQ